MVQGVGARLVAGARIGKVEAAADEADARANGDRVWRRKNENTAGTADAMHLTHECEGVFEMFDAFYRHYEIKTRVGPRELRGQIGDAKTVAESRAASSLSSSTISTPDTSNPFFASR